MTTLNAEDKILRAKIRLGKEKPFWSFLISYLKIRAEKPENMQMPTIGVSSTGDMIYNPQFIDTLNEEEVKGVLAHEVSHLVFDHLTRRHNRDAYHWNVAADVATNAVLLRDGFKLPHNQGLQLEKHYDDDDYTATITGTIEIRNVLKKCTEQIYDELAQNKKKNGKHSYKGTDYHEEGQSDSQNDQEDNGTKARQQASKEWKKRAIEAATFARMQGQLPAEIERLIGELANNKVSWKHLLRRYITNNTPHDFTYARPNKRSQSTGVYLPRVKKENTKVVVAIDTSGSISQEELSAFTTEIVSIARTLPHVELTVLQCDAKVHELVKVENGNIKTIKEMKIKGGGGTSFIPVFNKLLKLQEQTKVLVYFTDGYGDFPEEKKYPWTTIWAVTKNGEADTAFPFGKVVRLE